MMNALDNLLSGNPSLENTLMNGNIWTGDWVWNQACREAGTSACNPLFMAQIAPGSDTDPAPLNGILFIGSAFGRSGFAIGVPEPPASGPGEGDPADGPSIPGSTIVARGGIGDVEPPGVAFSGMQGQTVQEAGQGVPNGKFRWTTADAIRNAGGTVEAAPEFNERVGKMNYQHVDVCLGDSPCDWSDLTQNVAAKERFGASDYPYYDGYLDWGP
jgi:hypothetical protein